MKTVIISAALLCITIALFYFSYVFFYDFNSNFRSGYDLCVRSVLNLYFQSEVKTRLLSKQRNYTADRVDEATPILYWNTDKKTENSRDRFLEAMQNLKVAKQFKLLGKYPKALKIIRHAYSLCPFESKVLLEYGELLELTGNLLEAEHMYYIASAIDPDNQYALEHRMRTYPLVQDIDRKSLDDLDAKLRRVYRLPDTKDLKRIKRDQYFSYIYHSSAIEGNTLTYAQTKSILETRLAVGGKSLIEQNEVLGLDAAMKYINNSLILSDAAIQLNDILEIHRRVLGFVDLSEAGKWRSNQVYIGAHTPPSHEDVPGLMKEFVQWLSRPTVELLHPIERAALAHWYFVNIHPFYDGNGRTARLLMNVLLMRSGYPPAILQVEDRPIYYDCLQRANEGDVRWFIRFIAKAAEKTLDELLTCQQQETSQYFSEYEERLENVPKVSNYSIIYLGGKGIF